MDGEPNENETGVRAGADGGAGGGAAGAGVAAAGDGERVFESIVFEGDVLEAVAVPGEKAVEVTIIQPGLSANRFDYPEEVLRASLPMWDGVAAFCDHPSWIDQSRAGGRSVRDLCGVYSDVTWDNGIRAKLRFNGQSDWLYELVTEAIRDRAAGKAVAPLGISADMLVFRERLMDRWKIHQIRAVNSADVVFRPSAGGRFERILEGRVGDLDEETRVTNSEGANGTGEGSNQGGASGGGVATADRVSEAVNAELAAVREARVQLCGALLDQRLQGSALPAAAQERIRGQFGGRVFEARDLDAEIASLKELLGAAFQGRVVADMGVARAQMGLSSLEKINVAMERLFGLPVADAHSDIPRLSGIREAYILITGDKRFTGRYHWEESVLRESNEVTLAVMDSVVSNVMNKRLVADYRGQPKWWLPFVTRTSLRDMKAQTRILLNDFAALSPVSENDPYTNLAWGDSAETYTPTKRGNLVYVTLEMIINDDVRAVAHIPKKVAAAAVVTINEFVSGLFTAQSGTGPDMADGNPVFDAGNHQGNAGSTALSSTSLQAGITAIMKMTNSASKRLGITPRFLLIPPDLLWTARTITESSGLPGTANNDVNVMRGTVEPIVVPNWTDANNWYLMPDPAVVETIELGFLEGNEEPEFLVQDSPTAGTVFTNDAISFKVRHIYGGGWLDYRGAYGAVVS